MKTTQTGKDKLWLDEKGTSIPYDRINKVEKLHERLSYRLLKKATKLNAELKTFKEDVDAACQDAYAAYMKAKGLTAKSKGNFTWYNFNRTIKIEVNVNERIEFDDMGVNAAKEKLDVFLSGSIDSKNDFVKELVLSAFETSRGKLDSKKVLQLIRYRSKIKDNVFQKAIDLLEESIRRPDSRTYFRIWIKDNAGKYNNIDLNFSSL